MIRNVGRGSDQWTLDTDEEFFGEYRRGFNTASLNFQRMPTLYVWISGNKTQVAVGAETRPDVERLIAVFDRHLDESRVPTPPKPPAPPPPKPVVFIGHGKDQSWRDLKDHLHEQHGYKVEAYETGARAGHTIRDVLDGMAGRATFAILVMTGEDVASAEDPDDEPELRARQNVVHEVGLFQGKLGWERAVVATEKNLTGFSNLQGINQLRFNQGNIKEIFGDVLATLRREFGSN